MDDTIVKKTYEEPKVKILEFETEDVITASDELPIQPANLNW